jgi:D-alanyl-D-alanine carboxypeptidase
MGRAADQTGQDHRRHQELKPVEAISLSVLLPGLCLLVMVGCSPGPETNGVDEALQTLVDGVVRDNDNVHAVALSVDSPVLGVNWRGASGVADPGGAEAMTADRPVRIASNTKTYVAATVLRLVEEGRMAVDDPIAALLPDDMVALLIGGGYQPERMTVRHLLTHTSGLYDHSDSQKYGDAIMADPQHGWTRPEQLEAAMAWGEPWGAPGEIYTYCDTGYVLLGEIVEQVSGRPLAEAARTLLRFDALGLKSTWWEALEPAPVGVPARAHQFIDDVDTFGFDPSFDLYGGGGLVSTVGDIAAFYRAVFTGGVFSDPATVDLMLTTVEGTQPRPGADDAALAPGTYRMGIWVADIGGVTAYAHSGFWGTAAVFVPELDLVVAATVNQNKAKEALWEMVGRSIAIVRQQRDEVSQ